MRWGSGTRERRRETPWAVAWPQRGTYNRRVYTWVYIREGQGWAGRSGSGEEGWRRGAGKGCEGGQGKVGEAGDEGPARSERSGLDLGRKRSVSPSLSLCLSLPLSHQFRIYRSQEKNGNQVHARLQRHSFLTTITCRRRTSQGSRGDLDLLRLIEDELADEGAGSFTSFGSGTEQGHRVSPRHPVRRLL